MAPASRPSNGCLNLNPDRFAEQAARLPHPFDKPQGRLRLRKRLTKARDVSGAVRRWPALSLRFF